MRILRICLIALLLALFGCGDDGDQQAGPSESTTTSAPASTTTSSSTTTTVFPPLSQSCFITGENLEIEVSYPEGWIANEGGETGSGQEIPPCRVFHHEEFELPRANELLAYDVLAHVDNVPFERAEDSEPLDAEIIAEERVELAGRDVIRRELRVTQDGLNGPAGSHATIYVVDLPGERILVMHTHEISPLDYETNQVVLAEMVDSLSIPEVE